MYYYIIFIIIYFVKRYIIIIIIIIIKLIYIYNYVNFQINNNRYKNIYISI